MPDKFIYERWHWCKYSIQLCRLWSMSFWGAFVIANQGQWKKACIVSWGMISH